MALIQEEYQSCGETPSDSEPANSLTQQLTTDALPEGTRGWETIPGVIRNDGVETFRLEVDVNGPVTGVTLTNISFSVIPPEEAPVRLRDDGLG